MPATKHVKTKITLVGDKAVGKTSLIRRFVLDQFGDEYLLTLGAKIMKKTLQVPFLYQDLVIEIDMAIWDIMGQERFRDIVRDAYFPGTSGVIAVVDLTRRETLEGIPEWIRDVREVSGPVPTILAVNKKDLANQAAFGAAEIVAVSRDVGCEVLSTSAKTGENVPEAFERLATLVSTRYLGI